MRYRTSSFVAACILTTSMVWAGPDANPNQSRMSKQNRMEIEHAFSSDLVYARCNFPMGKTGLKLKDGQISPNPEDMARLMALFGPALKPGDQARITDLVFKDDHIHIELNGGPVKRQKWYKHISISGVAGDSPVAPTENVANPRGSYVDLYFDRHVPELTGPEFKQLLRPVFDFDAKSAREAYMESVPPKVKEAIENHHVLVGMNREMVIYSKGRPGKKIREKDGDIEWEEWIYGDPPKDVDFVRFVGDEVIRVETMRVDGQKVIRAEKEIDLQPPGAVTASQEAPERPTTAPTLRRPGEVSPDSKAADPSSAPISDPSNSDPSKNPG